MGDLWDFQGAEEIHRIFQQTIFKTIVKTFNGMFNVFLLRLVKIQNKKRSLGVL